MDLPLSQQHIAFPKKVIHSRVLTLQKVCERHLMEKNNVQSAALGLVGGTRVGRVVASVNRHHAHQ